MRLDVPHCQIGGVQPDDLVIYTVDPGLALLHHFRLEAAVAVTGDRYRQFPVLPPFSTLVDLPLRRLDWLGGALSPSS